MSALLDLDAIAAEWLKQCGPHDYGVDTAGRNCLESGEDPRPVISRLVAEVERLRGAIARVEALCTNPDGGAPPDGTIVFAHYTGGHQDIDQERIWQRSDGDDPHPDGDWYVLGENAGRHQWGEVLWLDDPVCDRGHVHLEWLIPVEEIDLALRGQVAG